MKIKLAILEKDKSYLNKIVSAFSTRYSDKFEIYSFTDIKVAMSILDSVKIDVFVANEVFDIDFTQIPKRCGFAYFVDSKEIDKFNNQRAICKFQKAELIYKHILSVYSENAGNISKLKSDNDQTKIITFVSPSGGVGTSSMAAACAVHFASKNKKTLYLNLEKYGSADIFFTSVGQFDMSDIIFSLKSRKSNLAIKLESCVKQDSTGVYFYSQSKIALDMLELNSEDLRKLITELSISGGYDYIILDMDFSIDKDILDIYRMAHSVVLVGDGSEISNIKLFRAYEAIRTKEQNQEYSIVDKLAVIYNKFSNKSGQALEIEVKTIGGAPRYEGATIEQIMFKISKMDMFNKII